MLVKPATRVFYSLSALAFQNSLFSLLRSSSRYFHASTTMNGHGDLNNSFASRPRVELVPEPGYTRQSFAISTENDDPDVRKRYRPFLLDETHQAVDWVAELELSTTLKLVESKIINPGQDRLRILVLYGSMRSRLVHNDLFLLDFFSFLCFSFCHCDLEADASDLRHGV